MEFNESSNENEDNYLLNFIVNKVRDIENKRIRIAVFTHFTPGLLDKTRR